MLKSMTGYGNAVKEQDGLTVRTEIKSLNSRTLDMNVKLPKALSFFEIGLRSRLSNIIVRGKVSVYIECEYASTASEGQLINHTLLKSLYTEVLKTATEIHASTEGVFSALLANSQVLNVEEDKEPGEEVLPLVEQALEESLQKFENFRIAEGASLEKELRSYIENIGQSLNKVESLKDVKLQKIKESLQEKLQQLLDDSRIDEGRLEQEMVYYAEKLDITEEIVRLRTHLNYFLETLSEESAGKKLSFISQEMGREINTIGSKANESTVQREIVMMKDELEKIKEQVQNVL